MAIFLLLFACYGCGTFFPGRNVEYIRERPITRALWENTNPHERVFVPKGNLSDEELEGRGVAYEPFRMWDEDGYLIAKSDLRKLSDYSIRLFVTPVTLAADLIVFGVLSIRVEDILNTL